MRVLVTGRNLLPPEQQAALATVADIDYLTPDNQDQLLEKVKDAEIIIGSNVSEQVMKAATKLRMIQTISAGYERVDMNAATKYGVVVCNNSETNAESVAELCFGLIHDVIRRISAHDRLMKAGKWERLDFQGEGEIFGKTLGILGLGAIGSRMAQIGSLAYSMPVIACDPYITNERATQFKAKLVEMDTLFKDSDIVTVHVPLSSETKHLVNKKYFDLMKPTAIFINASRGPVVDEKALTDTLKGGKICGAGLDVFETEPLPADSPLRSLENAVLVPHMGGSKPTMEYQRKAAVDNIIRVSKGMEPFRIRNPEVYYRSKKWFP